MTPGQAPEASRLLDGTILVLALCVAIMTAIFLRREFAGDGNASDGSFHITQVRKWNQYAVGSAVTTGDGTITIVEFSDFQCPYCRALHEQLGALRDRYPGRVTWLYRHFPLEAIHPHAFTAAIAAECALEQGLFSPFHDLLFRLQDSIGVLPWETFASRSGVSDLRTWRSCLAQFRYSDKIRSDMAAGAELGVRGTPTLLVNARRLPGVPPAGVLDSIIRSDLRQ